MIRNNALARLVAPLYLLACLVLGGASAGGLAANALLQAGGAILILLLLHGGVVAAMPRTAQRLLLVVGVTGLFLTLTLLPLPSALWPVLGGRAAVAAAYRMIGMPLPALSASLAPDGTISALLSLIPPVAMFLSVLAASPRGRLDSVIVLIAFTLASILFGVMQQIAGYRNAFYFYDITSRGGATAFFANRNHLATLCLMAMPFAAALAVPPERLDRAAGIGQQVIAGAVLLFMTLGALLVQSLAGWLLLVPTLLGCLLIRGRLTPGKPGRWPMRWLAPVAGIAVAVAVLAALFAPFTTTDLQRTMGEVSPRQRHEIMRLTGEASLRYLPFGSGFGSFDRVYPQQENPAEITNTFINHAHNDYLELLLEGGLVGAALLIAFLAWWTRQSIAIWARGRRDTALARGGSVAIAVVLAHSFVDYPVRTAAIAAVAALAAALMTVTGERVPARPSRRSRGGRPMISLGADSQIRTASAIVGGSRAATPWPVRNPQTDPAGGGTISNRLGRR